MKVELKCGEIYDFNLIKEVLDKGEVVEITGNFKPNGKNQTVSLWKRTIENWNVLCQIATKEKYYCPECDRFHVSGEIYENHLKYRIPEEPAIPDDRVLECDGFKLSDLAFNQLTRLITKLKKATPSFKKVYYKEINKLLLSEGVVIENV